MSRLLAVLALVWALVPSAGAAQSGPPSEPLSLHGRHRLAFGVGLLSEAEASPAGTRLSGINAGMSYTYWPKATWGVKGTAALHTTEAVPGAAATMFSMVAGPTVFPSALALGRRLRPYLSAGIGAYLGIEAEGRYWPRTQTQAVPGIRLGGGLGAFLGRWVYLGVDAAYHLAPDFSTPVADVENAGGPHLGIEIGLMLGGR